MKYLKITTIVLTATALMMFSYANVRRISPTEKLTAANLKSFKLTGRLSSAEITSLEKSIATTEGVTACTINATANIASIVYHPEEITTDELTRRLSDFGKVKADAIQFETKGGCPIQAMQSSMNTFLSAIDLRN